jgi:hypothetical protein
VQRAYRSASVTAHEVGRRIIRGTRSTGDQWRADLSTQPFWARETRIWLSSTASTPHHNLRLDEQEAVRWIDGLRCGAIAAACEERPPPGEAPGSTSGEHRIKINQQRLRSVQGKPSSGFEREIRAFEDGIACSDDWGQRTAVKSRPSYTSEREPRPFSGAGRDATTRSFPLGRDAHLTRPQRKCSR